MCVEVGSTVTEEIYRRGDTRGFHTRLLPPISEELHIMGAPVDETLVSNTFADSSSSPDPEHRLLILINRVHVLLICI